MASSRWQVAGSKWQVAVRQSKIQNPKSKIGWVAGLVILVVASVWLGRASFVRAASAAVGQVRNAPYGGAIHYLYVVPLSHLDIGFNYSVPEVIGLHKQYIDEAMDYAEQYPEYHWTIESVWQLDQWLAQTPDPAEIDRLRGLIEQGKISLTAGYANMHQGLMGSEELNRFVYPGRFYEDSWGLDLETAVSDDVPGSSWALPQVLAANGVRNLVAGVNTAFGGLPDIPVADYLFNWQGVDDSQVLTWMSANSYAEGIFTYWLSAQYQDMRQHTQEMIDFYEGNGYAYDSIIVMEGFDNDGADTILGALNNIERWNQEHTWPQILISTPDAFFQHVREVYGDDGFTVYGGDWSGRWDNGDTRTPVSTSQVRATRETAAQAETLAAVAFGLDNTVPYPAAQLDQIYDGLLVYDEHSGPGGGFDLTEQQINVSNQWFRQNVVTGERTAGRLLSQGLRALVNNIQTDQPALVVYNGLSRPRSDLVTIDGGDLGIRGFFPISQSPNPLIPAQPITLIDLETGAAVPTQTLSDGRLVFLAQDVPALGYRLYGLSSGDWGIRGFSHHLIPQSPNPRPLSQQIENDYYRVTVDEISGEITSLYDKVNGREVVDNTGGMGFNRLVRADQDAAVVWGTWEDAPAGPLQITSESGPVLSRLIITRAESPLSQTIITLPAGLPRVEIQNTLDHDRTQYADHLVHTYWYYVTMPFALGATGFSGRFQGPNGWLIPQQDWLPGAAHNARVSQQGVGVRDAAGFGVTLANRESYLSSFGSTGFWDATEPERPVLFLNLFARSDEALTADQGWLAFDTWEPGAPRQYTFNFALTSTDSGFDPVAAGTFSAGYNRPLLVAGIARRADGPLPGPTGSLLTVSHDNVAVVTLKRADFENPDGGDLILRLQEIDGQAAEGVTITLPFALDWAEVNGLGEQRADGVPLPVEPLTVSLAPYQTLTVRLRPIWSGD